MKTILNVNNLMTLINLKKDFLVVVFINLFFQLAITYYVMENTISTNNTNNKNNKNNTVIGFWSFNNTVIGFWPLFFIQLIILIVMLSIPMPEFIKFLLFCGFSYINGIMLSYLKNKYDPDMIHMAIRGALTIFALMFVVGLILLVSGIQLGYKIGAFLFFVLLFLIIGQLVAIGTKMTQRNKMVSFIGIILFAIYILYDTIIILRRNYYGNFITASMDYYLDIINLFNNLLGSSSSSTSNN